MVVCLIFDVLRIDLLALLVLVVLGITGIVPLNDIFMGFSSSAVISIVGVMIIGAGLEKAGLIASLANASLRLGRAKFRPVFLLLSLMSGFLAGFLRSIGGAALMLPLVSQVSVFMNVPRSRLLMPIGFCAVVGGSLTLIGSGPLLVLNDIIANHNLKFTHDHISPLGFFSVFPVGFSILLVLIAFFVFLGRFFWSDALGGKEACGLDIGRFDHTYGYGGQFYELCIEEGSFLVGKSVNTLEQFSRAHEVALVGVSRSHELHVPPLRKHQFEIGSRVALLGQAEQVDLIAHKMNLTRIPVLDYFLDILNPMRSGFSQIVIPPGSALIGTPVNDLHMRRNHQVQVLALYRGQLYRQGEQMGQLSVRSGDALGVFSEWKNLEALEGHKEFAIVTSEYPKTQYNPGKKPYALASFIITLCLILGLHYRVDFSLMVGALLMLVFRVIEIDEAYRAVSWRTVFLVAGLLPFGYAMQSTGAASLVAHWLSSLYVGGAIWPVVGLVSILAMLLGLLMGNVGATLVLVPIALKLASMTGVDPRMFAILTAVSTSNSFLLPTHQVNALIKGVGAYQSWDFIKVGIWVTLIYFLVLWVVAPFFIH